MKAFALLILLLFPSLALAQQQYYGTRAESVSLAAPGDPMDAALLTIHAGEIITPDNVRSSIQALYNTGRYRTITADANSGTAGTHIAFLVTAQYFFSTFRLEPANLLERPLTSYFTPPFGKKFSKAPVERLAVDAAGWLNENGYFNVQIEPEYIYDENSRLVTVVFKTTAGPDRAKIRKIFFHGGQPTLPDNDLKKELKVSSGDDFNADKLDKGVERIRQKYVGRGFLTARVRVERHYDPLSNRVDLDIEVDAGKTTSVQVTESDGSKVDISETKLRALVPIFEEGAVDSDLVEEGRQHIVSYYHEQGYFDATASAAVNTGPEESVRLDYVVTKGDRHRVRSIHVDGSAYFPEAEIIRKMKTQEGRSSSRGLFRPELLQADIRMIEAMYQNAGFQSTEVRYDRNESDDHDIDITIHIREGLRSVLNEIVFTGNRSFPEPVLWQQTGIQADQVYSPTGVERSRMALASYYYAHGFSEVRVETHLDFDLANNTVNVRFDLTEGPQYLIGWIFVAGNTLTANKVITRNSKLNRDDLYNPEEILEAQQRLYNLGIFNRVEIVTVEQDMGLHKNLLIQVEDTKPILFTPGIGITDSDGPRATIELSHFNLFGLARTMSIRLRGGHRERQLQASYRDPRLFNHDILGIASVRFDKTHHPFFDANEVDFSVQTVRKLSKTRTLSFSASYDTVNLQDIKVNPNIHLFPDATGSIQIARLGSAFIVDKRDSVSDPTRGTFVTTSFDVANQVWGSEVNFLSYFTQGSYFTPVHGGVIATSMRIGWKQPYGDDTELPISERFFAGGSTTLRGFKVDTAGPIAGGQLMTIANLEYRVPLPYFPIKNIGGALFYDTGNAFRRPRDFGLPQFTHSAGGGLRLKTPLGPIRTDIGFNLRPRPDERKYCVFFTLGHAF